MNTKIESYEAGRKAGLAAGAERGVKYVTGEEGDLAETAAAALRFPVPSYRAVWVQGYARGYRVGVKRTSPKAPKRSGPNIHNSERSTTSVLVRMDPELAAKARRVLADTGLTWAELIELGIDAKRGARA